jgi:hypothetical protein
MSDSQPKLEEISSSLEKLGDATEKAAEKHNWSARLQLLIAVLGVVIAALSVFNGWRIGQVQQAQDDLKGLVTAQQSEINIGTSVLHESMLAMDTKDQEILSRKVAAQVSFILALLQRYADDNDERTAFMQRFYRDLLNTLPSALSQSDARELSKYISDQIAQQPEASAPAEPPTPAAAPASAPVAPQAPAIVNGEASQPGEATGWNYDVFWCVFNTPFSKTNDSEKLAEVVFNGLVARQSQEHLGRIRLRRLPEIVNQTSPYQIAPQGVTIRSIPRKTAEANKLKAWVEQDLQSAHRTSDVVIEGGGQNLRLYLATFACLPQ